MLEIPISAAKTIADQFGYDQVVIVARRVGDEPDPHGEHVTTYGRDKAHCGVAARIGNFFKHKLMGWEDRDKVDLEAFRVAVTEAARKPLLDRISKLEKEAQSRMKQKGETR